VRHFLVALTGEKGSGKGVLARHLAAKHGYQVESFAAPLKRMCTHLMGWTAEQLADPVFKEAVDPRFGFAPRWFMQHLATECIRKEFGEDIWSEALVRRIQTQVNRAQMLLQTHGGGTPLRFVIDDLRFTNEGFYLCNLYDIEKIVIRINRGGRPTTGDAHVSEQQVYDIQIDEELDVPWYFDQEGEAEGKARTIGEQDLIRDFEKVLEENGFL